ncbi:MAG TPA: FkbM family methyltransferase [Solirubrobacteraceae bacterium]|nr:FkbM family methyltransferase [Solirubrobacteraceae bacterium]
MSNALRTRVDRITTEAPFASLAARGRALRSGRRGLRNYRDDRLVRAVAAAHLCPTSCCIDVGANVGLLLSTFADIAPHGHHIAFEPVPSLARALRERFATVDVRQIALSDISGTTSFVVHTSLPSRSSIRRVGYGPDETEVITVETERLDSALPPGYVPDLVKIDVEGAELLVLEGARETLQRARPLVLFEHQRETAQHYDSPTTQLWDLLDGSRYRVFDMDGEGPFSRTAFQALVEHGRRWNFLAKGC